MEKGSKRSGRSDKRKTPRFPSPKHLELLLQDQTGGPPRIMRMRDVSLRGFYFFSQVRHGVGSMVRFSIPFEFPATKTKTDLLAGVAKVVRCDELDPKLDPVSGERFGVAAKIEETTHRYDE
jgi:hypothetical protein